MVCRNARWALVGGIVWLVLCVSQALSADRIALLIANQDYLHITDLRNAYRDVDLIRKTLEETGYDVTMLRDATLDEMNTARRVFSYRARHAEVALIYYAGHGEMSPTALGDRRNHLLPVEIQPHFASFEDYRYMLDQKTLGVAELEEAVDYADVGIVLLDACRTSPIRHLPVDFPGRMRGDRVGLNVNRPAVNGVITMYAASEGVAAWDGRDRNSPFAEAFVEVVRAQRGVAREDRMDVRRAFRQIEEKVLEKTVNSQRPQVRDTLPSARVLPFENPWADIDEPGYMRSYLRENPGTALASLAQRRLDELINAPRASDRIKALRARADRGDADAMTQLGAALLRGPDVPVDERQAFMLLTRAAGKGSPEAMLLLAQIYEEGLGRRQNGAMAAVWYEQVLANRPPDAIWRQAEAGMTRLQGR